MTKRSSRDPGPSLRATPFGVTDKGGKVRLLTERQRQELASIATRVDVRARGFVYRENTPAAAVFICGEGALKTFRDLPSGKRRVLSFLFQDDLFGLSENGRYVNTAQATMPTQCYRLPLDQLIPILLQDPHLEFHILTKVTHELREAQHHGILIGRRSASARLATLLKMLETSPLSVQTPGTIAIPMSRTDIADYLGLTLESVSRATRQMIKAGVIEFKGPHAVRVTDRKRLEKIAGLA